MPVEEARLAIVEPMHITIKAQMTVKPGGNCESLEYSGANGRISPPEAEDTFVGTPVHRAVSSCMRLIAQNNDADGDECIGEERPDGEELDEGADVEEQRDDGCQGREHDDCIQRHLHHIECSFFQEPASWN